jgi:AcrR family transcriptional regulator
VSRAVPPTTARRTEAPGDAPMDVVRRAPFADNPHVGARGLRTQQRILDAALAVFAETGYDACGVDAIAQRAGCSRAAFYQYFASKEDVFRQLTGEVARALDASIQALAPLAPGAAGWRAVREWIARDARVHARYEPVFLAFQTASQRDDAVASGSARWAARSVARIRARIAGAALPPRELDPLIVQLQGCVTRTFDVARMLRSAAPGHYAEERVCDALADVVHRSLFGLEADVNVHPPASRRPPALRFEPLRPKLPPNGRQTSQALLEAGRRTFAERGYHRTRVADVADAAGVSRAAFYRYFESKDQLARLLTTQAMQGVSLVFAEFPGDAVDGSAEGRKALRQWLRRYGLAQANEAAMFRTWVDAALQDASLRARSAAALDWGRRAIAPFLARRGFGDVDTEAVVGIALLGAFGARERDAAEVAAAAHVVERGLLGLG